MEGLIENGAWNSNWYFGLFSHKVTSMNIHSPLASKNFEFHLGPKNNLYEIDVGPLYT